MTDKLRKALRRQKKNTQQEIPEITGKLGIKLGGQKVVEVPGRNSFVYVSLRDDSNEIIQAYNNKVAPSYGLPVVVERQGNRYVVVAVNSQRYQNNWNSFAPFLPRHGNTHSFDLSNGGGGDVVWVQSQQMTPLLILPSGTLGAPNVLMSSCVLKKENGTWMYVGNTGTQPFTPYLPSTGAIMGLVYLNTDDGNPYILINSGTVFSSSLTGTSQIVPYIPQVSNPSTQIPLAAIRLVTGTSQISWNSIYDVRQWLHSVPTGTGGGGGTIITGTTIQDEGVDQGVVGTLNFVGAGVNASVAGGVATITITGSSSGSNLTGTSVGLANKLVLSDSSGFLNTHPGLAWGVQGSNPFIQFGANIPNQVLHAGKIGYELFSTGYMEYVGAGTGTPRWHRFYDYVKVNEHLQVGSFQIPTLNSTWVYLNETGTAVGPINAPEITSVTGTDRVLGMRGGDNGSVHFSVESLFKGAPTVGTYTPTLTNSTNISASSVPGLWKYQRLGNIVTVAGPLSITPTASSGLVILGVSLPIASNFSDIHDATGNGTSQATNVAGNIAADTSGNVITLTFQSPTSSAMAWRVVAMYEIK